MPPGISIVMDVADNATPILPADELFHGTRPSRFFCSYSAKERIRGAWWIKLETDKVFERNSLMTRISLYARCGDRLSLATV
jgi:hypothetical protein